MTRGTFAISGFSEGVEGLYCELFCDDQRDLCYLRVLRGGRGEEEGGQLQHLQHPTTACPLLYWSITFPHFSRVTVQWVAVLWDDRRDLWVLLRVHSNGGGSGVWGVWGGGAQLQRLQHPTAACLLLRCSADWLSSHRVTRPPHFLSGYSAVGRSQIKGG